jgi:hypothetical protein
MEAADSSETLILTYQTTWHHTQEGRDLEVCRSELLFLVFSNITYINLNKMQGKII